MVLEELHISSSAFSHLVCDMTECKKYVIKKTECLDESEANKSFNEVMALKKLKNPYVCEYNEVFVAWNKQESSVLLCTIMKYYADGDLQSFLYKYRQQQENLMEQIVMKYIVQIMEALKYINCQNIVHRNLKPSNIFFKEDGSLCLGDFMVLTVVSDLNSCSRFKDEKALYMAPEVITHPFSMVMDVWSLGCLLLDMTTTTVCTQSELASKLTKMKSDIYILEDVFEEVSKHFSDDCINLIRAMLKIKHENRPTVEKLSKKKCIINCMKTNEDFLMGKDIFYDEKPVLEKHDDTQHIIDFIFRANMYEECICEGLLALHQIFNSNNSSESVFLDKLQLVLLKQRNKDLITSAMSKFILNVKIQLAGCAILSILVMNAIKMKMEDVATRLGDPWVDDYAEPDGHFLSPEALQLIIKVLKEHGHNADVLKGAIGLMYLLCSNDEACTTFGQHDSIKYIVSAMRFFSTDVVVQLTCCSCLWSLSSIESNVTLAANENAIHDVCLALKNHIHVPDVVEFAAAAMFSLCLDERCLEIMIVQCAVESLLIALDLHIANHKAVTNICMALSSIVEINEECAYQMLAGGSYDDSGHTGISILVKSYRSHCDNAKVVEVLMVLMYELSKYDDAIYEMEYVGLISNVLSKVCKRYNKYMEINVPCEKVIARIMKWKNSEKTIVYDSDAMVFIK